MNTFINLEEHVPKKTLVKQVSDTLMLSHRNTWQNNINRRVGNGGRGRNKLRHYCQFKLEYSTEHYCTLIMAPKHRAALSKFRYGVAPIRIETGRYENLPELERLCPFCNTVETEIHVLLKCFMYQDIRVSLLSKALTVNPTFNRLSDEEQMYFLLSNKELSRISAKTCYNILQTRMFYLYN